jgi:head-tail adaptor
MSIVGRINVHGRRIDIKRPILRRDSVGSRRQTFVHQGTVNGYVASRSETEGFQGDRQQAVASVTVYVKGGTDLKVTDRLTFDGRTYEVTGVRTPGHRDAGDRNFYHIVDATSNEGV